MGSILGFLEGLLSRLTKPTELPSRASGGPDCRRRAVGTGSSVLLRKLAGVQFLAKLRLLLHQPPTPHIPKTSYQKTSTPKP